MLKADRIYRCVGIDGCEGKWIAVFITEGSFEIEKFRTIGDICNKYPDADSYIIDIPIGLVEDGNQMRPDKLVTKVMGRKSSSIFGVPCRQAIYADDKKTARECNIAIIGKSLSEQTLAISKAIRQVDDYLENNPQWKNKIIESHPELCFSKLNNNQPILENKN